MSDWQIFARYPNAQMFFRQVRVDMRLMDEYRFIIENGAQPRGGGGHAGISDPTASKALFLLTTDQKEREKAKRKLAVCDELVGVGLRVINAVDKGLGERYAHALELHYVDCLSIRDCAERLNVSAATVKRDLGIACDWLDSQKVGDIFR